MIMNTLILLFYKIGVLKRVPQTIINKNYELNTESILHQDISGYIENQNKLDPIRIGKRHIPYCGCGVVAVYNALISLGSNMTASDFLNLIKNFEKSGLVFSGKFGIAPQSIKSYLTEILNKSKFTIRSTESVRQDKINIFGAAGDVFVCTVLNNGSDIRKGIHHICVNKDDSGNFISHNPNFISHSLYDVLMKATNNTGKSLYITSIRKV